MPVLLTICWLLRLIRRTPEPAAAKPVDEDEDIFGDAGKEYEPDLVRRDGGGNAAAAAPAQAQAKGAYFSERGRHGGPARAAQARWA